MNFKLTGTGQVFPAGTTVKAYPASNYTGPERPAAPKGAAAAEAVVAADGTAEFAGLTDGTRYWAIGEVASAYRVVGILPKSPTGPATKAEVEVLSKVAPRVEKEGLALGEGASVGTGVGNVAIGYHALKSNLASKYCTAVGWGALENNVGGGGFEQEANQNTGIGAGALHFNTTGSFNTAVGMRALYSNITGIQNTAMGDNALEKLTGGEYNTAIGTEALWVTQTGSFNTAIGNRALSYSLNKNSQTAIGNNCLRGAGTAEAPLFTGELNVGVGASIGTSMTTASKNTLIGTLTGEVLTEGSENVGVGFRSLHAATTGSANVAIGPETMNKLTTGEKNVAIGKFALGSIEASKESVAIGHAAMFGATGGKGNTAIGTEAGSKLTGASEKNVLLGFNAGPTAEGTKSNKLYIANARTDEPLILGDFAEKELRFYTTKIGLFGVAPVARAAAIASPAAELAALKTAVDALRLAVKGIGITE